MPDRLQHLPDIHHACWQELARAVGQPDHGWRVMALASAAVRDGQAEADVRSVVLRQVQAEARLLVFFTDARSPKVVQLQAQPLASLLLWCPRLGWQLRLRVQVEVQTTGLAVSSAWARMKLKPGAQDYLSPLPPGAPLDDPAAAPPAIPAPEGRNHFALVEAQVQAIDWLELHADGHRRALFDAAGIGRWVTP